MSDSVIYAIAPNDKVESLVAVDNPDIKVPDDWHPIDPALLEGDDPIDCGWTTLDNGQTWIPGEPPLPPVEITPDQMTAAALTLQQLLDPSTPSPSVPEALNALAVLVASTPVVDNSTAVLVSA